MKAEDAVGARASAQDLSARVFRSAEDVCGAAELLRLLAEEIAYNENGRYFESLTLVRKSLLGVHTKLLDISEQISALGGGVRERPLSAVGAAHHRRMRPVPK